MRSSTVLRSMVALASVTLLTLRASAQDSAADGEARARAANADVPAQNSQPAEEVVVRGQRMSEIDAKVELRIQARAFVGTVAASPAGRGYARWSHSVCVGVHNLERTPAQYIVDRISRLALEVGLEPGEPECAPDVIIIFTTDGKGLAASMVEEQPGLFRPVMGREGTSLGLAALDEFAATDRPVRWWHVTMPVDARTGQPAIRLPQGNGVGGVNYPVVNVAGPSRLHSGIRDELRRVVIIVDSTKLSGTTWQELGDYLAVVSLVQIDPDADPSEFDSILNLFSNPEAYSGLTDWDRTYVRAVYAFDQERRPELQVSELVDRMVRRELDDGR